jgi:hypothetical protein
MNICFPTPDVIFLFDFMRKNIQLPFFCYLHPEMVVKDRKFCIKAVDAGLVDTIIAFQSGKRRIFQSVFTIENSYSYTLLICKTHHSYTHVSKSITSYTGIRLSPMQYFLKH